MTSTDFDRNCFATESVWSVERSSTMMISVRRHVCASADRMVSAIHASALWAGIRIETKGFTLSSLAQPAPISQRYTSLCTLGQRTMIGNPGLIQVVDHLDQLIQPIWLYKIGASAQMRRSDPVRLQSGSAQNKFRHPLEFRPALQPFEQPEAVQVGHFQVGDDQARQRMALAICIIAVAI